jgi:hypothetical protein
MSPFSTIPPVEPCLRIRTLSVRLSRDEFARYRYQGHFRGRLQEALLIWLSGGPTETASSLRRFLSGLHPSSQYQHSTS